MVQDDKTAPVAAALTEEQRRWVMKRFAVLRPHLEDDVPLARAARYAGIPVRTAERWLARYRQAGLWGLARSTRSDAAGHRLPGDLVALIEGMGLKKPRASAAASHRRIGKPVRPWLTTVVDDYSRAVAGIMLFFGSPSILNTSLALRQAIWRKADPSWPVCGIPDVLYVDHGSDFTSNHLIRLRPACAFASFIPLLHDRKGGARLSVCSAR